MVTLISDSDYKRIAMSIPVPGEKKFDPVWGAAYHIPQEHVKEVSDYMDLREINGYSIQHTTFIPASSDPNGQTPPQRGVLTYVGLPSNPQFLGYQSQEDIAKVIVYNKGPSGLNRDYLFELERALAELSVNSRDEHVSNLVQQVTRILS